MHRHLIVTTLALALAAGEGLAAAGQARERPGSGQAPRATASSGQSTGTHAVPRGGGSGSGGGSTRATAPRGGPSSAPSSARSAPPSGSPGRYTGSGRSYTGGYARPRDGRYVTGSAVPRGSVHPRPPIYYPPSWGGSWYYPYYPYYGMWGLGWYYYPYDYGYGGWGWGPYSNSVYVAGYGYDGVYAGSVRLKVRPRDAQVFVDGYYVGIVDEFDGRFQQLRLEEGPHQIEVKKEGYSTLGFKVRVTFDHTINLAGELVPLAPLP